MSKIKCVGCNLVEKLDFLNVDNWIKRTKTDYMHHDCYKKWCYSHTSSKGKLSARYVKFLDDFDEVAKKTKLELETRLWKEKIYWLILGNYKMESISDGVFKRLETVYDGTREGMTRPIPPDHMYDMWTRQMSKLNEIWARKMSRSSDVSEAARIYYDIAVLIKNYDGYLTHLEEQKRFDDITNDPPPTDYVVKYIAAANISEREDDEMDISKLTDDIFG